MPLPPKLRPLFEERTSYLRDPYYQDSQSSYLYLLVEPDEKLIRYVGICVNPLQRYAAHTRYSHSDGPPCSKWIASLRERNELPRIHVATKLEPTRQDSADAVGASYRGDLPVDMSLPPQLLEAALISRATKRFRIGSNDYRVDLLNVMHNKSRKKFCQAG